MAALRTRLAAVMEALVHAAVAQLQRLVESSSAPQVQLQLQVQTEAGRVPSDTWKTTVRWFRDEVRLEASLLHPMISSLLGRMLNV